MRAVAPESVQGEMELQEMPPVVALPWPGTGGVWQDPDTIPVAQPPVSEIPLYFDKNDIPPPYDSHT